MHDAPLRVGGVNLNKRPRAAARLQPRRPHHWFAGRQRQQQFEALGQAAAGLGEEMGEVCAVFVGSNRAAQVGDRVRVPAAAAVSTFGQAAAGLRKN